MMGVNDISKKAILIHGWASKKEYYNPKYPSGSNSHWFPWLSKQLIIRDIHTVALEMPQGYYPQYEIWKRELERFELDSDTILVGHSCGGGFLVRYLCENKNLKLGKVILVAPWIGIKSKIVDENDDFDKSFFDFEFDRNAASRTKELILFNSSNDMAQVQKSVDIIRANIDNIKYIELENKGHFTSKGLGGEKFTELLEEIIE